MTTETIQIEYTDRYGGRTPSHLRGCFGQCEAMGVYPVSSTDPELTTAERQRIHERILVEGPAADGWYFITCPECNGTGRVSWLRTIARVPRWLWRGVKLLWQHRPSASVWQGHPASWWARVRINIDCAFVLDLVRLRN